MKKYLLIIFAALVLMLTACARASEEADGGTGTPEITTAPTQTTAQTQPTATTQQLTTKPMETTVPPTTEVTVPPTTQPVETTQPTEPSTEPTQSTEIFTLEASAWLQEPEYLSHEAYFAVDRTYVDSSTRYWGTYTTWAAMKDGEGFLFKLLVEEAGVIIQSEAFESRYLVPDSAQYRDYGCLAADGKYGYLCSDTRILRLDLLTGEAEVILEAVEILSVRLIDKMVLHYIALDESMNAIVGRMYLPDQWSQILYQGVLEVTDLGFNTCYGNHAEISWTMMNPEFLEAMRRELADPNSPYKHDRWYDYSDVWNSEDPVGQMLTNYYWMDGFENAIGIRAFLTMTWDPNTNTICEETGIIDSCWYGSGFPHDHYHPDETTEENPVSTIGSWQSLTLTPWNEPMPDEGMSLGEHGWYRILPNEKSEGVLYWVQDGKARILTDIPVTEVRGFDDSLICLTEDGRVIQVSYDGAVAREVYTAKEGELQHISKIGNRVSFLDGDVIVEVDLETGQYRQLMRQAYIIEAYYWGEETEEGTAKEVYFAVRHGMFYQQYILDLSTGEIRETFFL